MASVGDYLRELRDRRGISLEEISRITRVASSYLEALESDRQSALPAPVFTRGFIRAYCQALGESPDEALARYDGREGGVPAPPRPAAPPSTPATTTESEARSRSAVLVSFVLLVILGMALFAGAADPAGAGGAGGAAHARPGAVGDRGEGARVAADARAGVEHAARAGRHAGSGHVRDHLGAGHRGCRRHG